VVLRQRGTRPALAGLCLVALSITAGAPLFAAEAQKLSAVEAGWIGQSVGVDVQGSNPGLVSHGGAIYSPFSTASDVAAPTLLANIPSTQPNADDGSPNLVTAAVAVLVAAGFLVALVRFLIAS
jgi:hypothetical protein